MRFRSGDYKASSNDNGNKGNGNKSRETRPAPKELRADDQPQLEGLSDREAAAVIAARFGMGRGPNAR